MFAGWNEPVDFEEELRSADEEAKEMAGTTGFSVLFNLGQRVVVDWLAVRSQTLVTQTLIDGWETSCCR
jgi:hypothetical protein